MRAENRKMRPPPLAPTELRQLRAVLPVMKLVLVKCCHHRKIQRKEYATLCIWSGSLQIYRYTLFSLTIVTAFSRGVNLNKKWGSPFPSLSLPFPSFSLPFPFPFLLFFLSPLLPYPFSPSPSSSPLPPPLRSRPPNTASGSGGAQRFLV